MASLWTCYISAQTNSITYSASNKPLTEILQDIEKQTNYRFSYNSNIINNKQVKTVNFNNATITTVLQKTIGDFYNYSIIGNQIVITEKKSIASTPKKTSEQPIKEKVVVYDTVQVYDKITVFDTVVENVKVFDTLQHIETITMHRYETNFLHTAAKCGSISLNTGLMTNAIHFYNGGSYGNELQHTHTNALSFDAQLHATLKVKNLLPTTGFDYYNFRLENSFATSTYTDDPSITYTDTLWYWKYNEIFTYYKFNQDGDSVAVTAFDSTYTYTLRHNPKKIEHKTEKLSTLSWQYISIPIGLGYHYNLSNTFAIQPILLFNTMLLVNSKGEIVNEPRTESIQIKDILKRVTFSATIACNILYSLEQQYSVTIKPFCTITPCIFRESKSRFQGLMTSLGLEWGFCYTIPYDI